jgi:hypothetical protein
MQIINMLEKKKVLRSGVDRHCITIIRFCIHLYRSLRPPPEERFIPPRRYKEREGQPKRKAEPPRPQGERRNAAWSVEERAAFRALSGTTEP